jgi:hypothetical protein
LLFKKKVLPVNTYKSNNDDLICDIKDGSFYRDFINSIKKVNDSDIYSFMLNTDGISLCEKSKLSSWPVYLVINELPIEERFHVDNIILAGICVGNTKPLINEYLTSIKKELFEISLGFEFDKKWLFKL